MRGVTRLLLSAVVTTAMLACGDAQPSEVSAEGIDLSATCLVDRDRFLDTQQDLVSMETRVQLVTEADFDNVVFRVDAVTPAGEVIDQHESSFSGVKAGTTYSQEIRLNATAVPDDVVHEHVRCEASLVDVNVENPPLDTGL